MARKTRRTNKKSTSSLNPSLIGGIITAIVAVAGYLLLTHKAKPTSDATNSDAPAIANVGNEIRYVGEVVEILGNNEKIKILSLKLDNQDKEINICLPSNVSGPNIGLKQNYVFETKVMPGGWNHVTSYSSL